MFSTPRLLLTLKLKAAYCTFSKSHLPGTKSTYKISYCKDGYIGVNMLLTSKSSN